MDARQPVIVSGVRTAIGSFGGGPARRDRVLSDRGLHGRRSHLPLHGRSPGDRRPAAPSASGRGRSAQQMMSAEAQRIEADATDVIHGVVWPLLESEDESADTPGQIEAVLREAGVRDVLVLDQRFPMEYCDDCGAPLYPNPEGEPVHAELPEPEEEAVPRHLH